MTWKYKDEFQRYLLFHSNKKIKYPSICDYTEWLEDELSKTKGINNNNWVSYNWNDIQSRPPKYGKYFVHRKDGKVHWETWNGSGWAYNEKVITHWQEVKPPNPEQTELNTPTVNGSSLLYDLLSAQQEIISNPKRFNGVSIEDIKKIFSKHGIEYNQPF